jgi:hypothetical protein
VLHLCHVKGLELNIVFQKLFKIKTNTAPSTRPETICPDTSKLACWRVKLAPACTVVHRGAGPTTASIEVLVLAVDINHLQAQMIPFLLTVGLCCPPALLITTGGCNKRPLAQEICIEVVTSVTRSSTCYTQVKLIHQQVTFKLKYQHKQHFRKVYFTQTTCMMTNVSEHT